MKKRSFSKKKERFSDCEELNQRVIKEGLPSGDYLYDYRLENIKKEFANMNEKDLLQKMKLYFRNLPISLESIKALTQRNFVKLTEVQRCAIPHALSGRDILVASKTGSGKTLSYVLPVIENLYRKKWTTYDQVGALVLVPTRELAVQVFEVFRSLLTDFHELSYGLIVGGKSLQVEQAQIGQMNILICTPGRLLQHINETELFSLDNLQMLILDEADEILSLGFSNTLTQILNAIPRKTQTMLFSATLNKGILSLSKIALNNSEQIFLHDKNSSEARKKNEIGTNYEIPANLTQYAMVIPHEEKIDVLFSFIKSHKFNKIIVFVSCCKQVRFIYESFKKLRIGLPMFELHARQQQAKRMAIYFNFTESKYGVLISTNLAARGLDFPKVNWIIQLDLPENVETYVHRIGRTARFQSLGKSLVLVDASERQFLKILDEHKFKVSTISPNPSKQLTIQKSLQTLCSENNDLKYLAQRAVISFVRSNDFMPNKAVFDIKKINLQKLSESYGLIQTPVIKFEESENESENEEMEKKSNDDQIIEKDEEQPKDQNAELALNRNQKKLMKFKQKLKEKKGIQVSNDLPFETKNIGNQINATRETQLINRVKGVTRQTPENDDFLTLKKREIPLEIDAVKTDDWKISKRQSKKIKPSGVFDGKNVFDITEDSKIVSHEEKIKKEFENNLKQVEQIGVNLSDVYAIKLKQNEDLDKLKEAERIKAKRLKKKEFANEVNKELGKKKTRENAHNDESD